MALTKVTGQVINNSTGLVVGVTTVGGGLSATDGFFSGIVTAVGNASFSGNLTVGGVLTYEDVTNVDSVGLITARNGVVVGSGITLSKDGDGFFTGIVTATTFSGAFSGDGSALTGVANTDVIFPDKISFSDSAAGSINLGIGSDLQIFHDGSQSVIKEDGGLLQIRCNEFNVRSTDDSEKFIKAYNNGAVELYHDNSKKLETASGGVTVTGTVAATSYTGDGSSLTGISVGIATTAASMTGITTVLDLSKDDFKVTASGITTVDVRGGTEGGSHMLRIVNSGITTVGFSTYFLFPSGGTPALPTTDGAISLISFTVHRQGAVGLATQLLAGSSVNFS